VKARLGDRLSHRPSELKDDGLLALLHGVENPRKDQEERYGNDSDSGFQGADHGFFPSAPTGCPDSTGSQGTRAFCSLSTM